MFLLSQRGITTRFSITCRIQEIFARFIVRSLICTGIAAFEAWLFFFYDWLLFVGVFIAPILIIGTKSAFALRLFHTIEAESELAKKTV